MMVYLFVFRTGLVIQFEGSIGIHQLIQPSLHHHKRNTIVLEGRWSHIHGVDNSLKGLEGGTIAKR